MKQKLQKTINQVIGKSGNLSVPSWWMRKILNDIVEYCGENKGISNSPDINSNSKIVFDLIKLGDPIEANDYLMKFSKEQFESAIEMSASEFIEKIKSGVTVVIHLESMIILNPFCMADFTNEDNSNSLFVIGCVRENWDLIGLCINKDFSLQIESANIIEVLDLVTQTELNNKISDWNALEGENGYIKNKPISVTETLVKDYTLVGINEYKLSTNGGIICFNHLVDGEIVNESREIESFTGEQFISPNGVDDFTLSNNNGSLHLITPYDPIRILNEIRLKEKYYTPLQENFIPKTIARTQDVENAIEDLRSNIESKMFVEITYAELVALRDRDALTAGTYYRITDYETTTAQENTRSAGHPFDVVVLALSESTLAEEAYAVHSDRDTNGYFQSCNLSAWKLWYALDNNAQRFAWADTQNGKGVIYRMIDEYNNDLPYDFKNIQFARYELNIPEYNEAFTPVEKAIYDMVKTEIEAGTEAFVYAGLDGGGKIWESYEERVVSTASGRVAWCYTFNDIQGNPTDGYDYSKSGAFWITNNYMEFYIHPELANKYLLPNNVFLYEGVRDNHFGFNVINNTFMSVQRADITSSFGNVASMYFYDVKLRRVNNSAFARTAAGVKAEDCSQLFLGELCERNEFGTNCCNIVLGKNSSNNIFGKDCINIVMGEGSSRNTFGLGCADNLFSSVNECVFGIEFSDNDFSKAVYVYGCVFGNYTSNNTCGVDTGIVRVYTLEEFNSNTLNGNIYKCTFGADCHNNTFGGLFECAFGNGAWGNNVGNLTRSTFLEECHHNTVGVNCSEITFGNYSYGNTIGDNCRNITFENGANMNAIRVGNTDSAGARHFCRNICFEEGVSGVVLYNSQDALSEDQGALKNIVVKKGFESTSSVFIGVEADRNYETSVAKNSQGEIKIYCEADLIS